MQFELHSVYKFIIAEMEESSILIPGMGRSAAIVEPNYSFGKF